MSMPLYVSPEQLMKDRSEFARKGIARGRSAIVLSCADGVLFVAENHSRSLRKVSEIYDRIGFAAVGSYHEFEALRIAGIRHADLRGYAYDRLDVTGRSLANAYAQLMGAAFSSGSEKPFEVELTVAELGQDAESDQLFRLTYDGSITDEGSFTVMGGNTKRIAGAIADDFDLTRGVSAALRSAVAALGPNPGESKPRALEVALLDRRRTQRRTFRRIGDDELAELLRD